MVEQARILIAGIGNIFFGDDAFGVEVVKRLFQRQLPAQVRVADFGIRGIDLAYAIMDGYEVTILVDAIARGGEPGTIYLIEPDIAEIEHLASEAFIETHAMNPMRVLGTVKSMGGTFKRILLIGCEPAVIDFESGQLGLSAPVEAALDEAVAMIESLITSNLNRN